MHGVAGWGPKHRATAPHYVYLPSIRQHSLTELRLWTERRHGPETGQNPRFWVAQGASGGQRIGAKADVAALPEAANPHTWYVFLVSYADSAPGLECPTRPTWSGSLPHEGPIRPLRCPITSQLLIMRGHGRPLSGTDAAPRALPPPPLPRLSATRGPCWPRLRSQGPWGRRPEPKADTGERRGRVPVG